MISVEEAVRSGASARILAQAFLTEYFHERQVTYPINPFQMLTDLGVPFVFRAFSNKSCEGMYLPAQGKDDVAIVGINIKRPITRQRYTTAHELCHHIKDSRSTYICNLGSNIPIERYAESFAAELLMPYTEMKQQILKRAPTGYLTFDQVLEIADYFGVSFSSCLIRAASSFHKIEGKCEPSSLKKRAEKFGADKKRKVLGYTYADLYAQVIDAGEDCLYVEPSEFVKRKYCNEYVYNDARMEGINIGREKVAEIVTDIKLHKVDSPYCTEQHENEVAIAGHALMYDYLFSIPEDKNVDIFSGLVSLHRQLFSCAPSPEFGGAFRKSNPLVMGAKFETIDSSKVIPALLELSPSVQRLLERSVDISLSQYVKEVAIIHHKLTVIHPFGDGNGRTLRAFMNLLLIRRKLPPIYFKVEEKKVYLEALAQADRDNAHCESLYEVVFKAILRAQAELTEAPPL